MLIYSKKLDELAEVLQAMAEPNRLKIICLLAPGAKCVCEIEKALALKQNLVSHHLKVLRDCGLIDSKKHGQWKHYSLNRKKIGSYQKLLNTLLTQSKCPPIHTCAANAKISSR